MAWDTDATQRKLLLAGARQFAAAGFAGARIEAIGADAGVNKERIYRYFGDKRAFFAAVLGHELAGLLDGLDVTGTGAEAIGDFVAQLLDRCERHPELPRLLLWESLELDAAVAIEQRRPVCAHKVDGILTALPALDRGRAEHLLFSLIALAVGWCELGNLGSAVVGGTMEWETRRATVVAHARALATGMTEEAEASEASGSPRSAAPAPPAGTATHPPLAAEESRS
ncbi:TetR/AcrR family transcriptional regulator [Leucobacter massiliensis]|uniref:HTH tetR-type domain-containing protein n=1 Tax=Leucobacter massiliensis TaxID=1686285 RepID=A0A2S9QKE2_9MICO|nr:TetR family transcriptional regulator [Leucobacter massiliensis]PRI10031.1 hypothetical protein B4915_14000 [Leucobacter massiliensis]PRI10056.1 hypothetical protein B4915_14155 [Leucobacter massiliensis]